MKGHSSSLVAGARVIALITDLSLLPMPKECEIPEEFRMADVNPIEVMDYLQIRRAEPLRVERNDWE